MGEACGRGICPEGLDRNGVPTKETVERLGLDSPEVLELLEPLLEVREKGMITGGWAEPDRGEIMNNGIIFDIKRYSIHDGPGIRTTFFLKGCPFLLVVS